jgi:hypothetical protein
MHQFNDEMRMISLWTRRRAGGAGIGRSGRGLAGYDPEEIAALVQDLGQHLARRVFAATATHAAASVLFQLLHAPHAIVLRRVADVRVGDRITQADIHG